MRKLLVMFLLFGMTAYAKPERRYWRLVGFGIPLVECELIENKTQHCKFISNSDHPLDGVMEAIHRGVKAQNNLEGK